MERVFRQAQWVLVRGCVLLGVTAAVVGCRSVCSTGNCGGTGGPGRHNSHPDARIDNCSDIPPGAIPQPIGTFTNNILNRQVEKGEADAFVIYYNEWLDGERTLGPYGRDHLRRIVARLPGVPFAVIMQPEPDKAVLNGRRHIALVEALTEAGIPEAEKRVLLGRPWGEGLFGEEGENIYPQLLRGGGGGFGGGGFR